MSGRGTIVTARLSLSVRPAQPQVECAFSCEGEEVSRTATPLPNQGLLRKCRDEIALAAHGHQRARSDLPSLQRELRRVISRSAISFLRAMLTQRPEVDTLALEVMLNNPDALDGYPWELLSQQLRVADRVVTMVVWRSVAAERPDRSPSRAVLLVGSASFDAISTNAPNEIAYLGNLLRGYTGIHPHEHPSITFMRFANLLQALKPSIIHIVTHGTMDGFQFQRDPDFPKDHDDITPQEIGTYLASSPTANLVILNACNSARSWNDRPALARHIATMSRTTTIGMAAEIPNEIGADFSKDFFHALALGKSTIEAFGSAAHAIRRAKKFATLWSSPVMYAPPESNVILFPADPMGRMRLRFQELDSQLRQLDSEIAALFDYSSQLRPDCGPGIGTMKIRLAYIRGLLNEPVAPGLEGPAHVHGRLSLAQARDHAGPVLTQLRGALERLQDPRRPRDEWVRTAYHVRETLARQRRTLAQLEREFTHPR
jgi:hypothetical protein